MAVVLASGQGPMGANGTIRWAISGQGPALGLFRRADQNRMIRVALRLAGHGWTKVFLPKRFSDYVERKPFPYAIRRNKGFFYNKARRMGLLDSVFQRLFNGWDPWSAQKPGPALIEDWKRKHPGKYRRSITGQSSGLIADLRANAKRMVREIVAEWESDGRFTPLIESGELQKTAKRARATATSTQNRQQIRIKVPFPGPRNPRVGDTIRTLPRWEVTWIAQKTKEGLIRALGSRGATSPQTFRDASGTAGMTTRVA